MTQKSGRRKTSAALARDASAKASVLSGTQPYQILVGGIEALLEQARRTSARAVNAFLTATYWQIGQRIVEYEQQGKARAEYGAALLESLSADLTRRFGRGFGVVNLSQMKKFYLLWPVQRTLQRPPEGSPPSEITSDISALPARKSLSSQNRPRPSVDFDGPILQAVSEEFIPAQVAPGFPLPWSAYVRLLAVRNEHARRFYETEALRGGWSIRQLGRQIDAQFYERTALSRDKAAMLKKGARPRPEDALAAEEEVKDPYVLEFLGLRDEYSEMDLEQALIRHLESFSWSLAATSASSAVRSA